MNGYVAGADVVEGYVRHINALFQRPDYLDAQQREFDEEQPSWAFTEMRAFESWRDETDAVTRPLTVPVGGVAFDDGLCFPAGYRTEKLRSGQVVKRVYLGEGGTFWARREGSGRWDRLGALNLSWVPVYLFDVVFGHLKTGRPGASVRGTPPSGEGPTLGAVHVPLKHRPQDWWIRAKGAINRAVGRA
jgi:hypothetical protein